MNKLNNKYCIKTDEIAKIIHCCKRCNNVIQIIKKKDIISTWDYVIPRIEKCQNCGVNIK